MCTCRKATVFLIFLGFIAACNGGDWRDSIPDPVDRDLAEILEQDTLEVLTTYNSTGYFLYRGQAMGFQHDLLQAFAEDHDLNVRFSVQSTRDSIYHKLNDGRGDIVADRVVPVAADSGIVRFTRPLYETTPVLVQRESSPSDSVLPEGVDTVVEKARPETTHRPITELAKADTSEELEIRARIVDDPSELGGQQVTLPFHSEYVGLLAELEDETTGDIHVVELDTAGSYETVIRYVSTGDFNFTVSPENLAKLKAGYFENIRTKPTMGPEHEVAWAVRRNAPVLLDSLNAWIEARRGTSWYRELYNRFFVDRRGYNEREDSEYLTGETGRLSDYDNLLRMNAEKIDWDWRLLASQTYQESRFEPTAKSWAGAAGLLQLMPPTAREFGVTNVYDPEDNVAGAVRYLQWLTDYWDGIIEDDRERLKFILASYNTGHGHVEDARRLAEKNGDDNVVWADVALWLLQKSKREVYQDPVVKYGFCRGLEPVMYVSHILARFEHYREFVDYEAAQRSFTAVP